MKIRMKMGIGFGLIILMVALMSWFVITQLNTIEKTYDYTIKHPISAGVSLRNFRISSRDFQRLTATISTSAGFKTNEEIKAYYQEAVASYEEARNFMLEFEANVSGNPRLGADGVKTRVDKAEEIIAALDDYKRAALDTVYGVALAGDHAGAVEALFDHEYLLLVLTTTSGELIEISESTMDEAINNASDQSAQTKLFLIAILVVIIFVSIVLSLIISRLVARPIKRLLGVAESVSKGHLNINIDTSSKDETGVLAGAFSEVIGIFNEILSEIKDISHIFHEEGDIEARLDVTRFAGEYRVVMESVNEFISGIVSDTLLVIGLFNDFKNGEFSTEVPVMPGKKKIVNDTVASFRAMIKSLNSEINALAKNAADGKMSSRADENAFNGGWALMMKGLNSLMDAVAAPAAEVVKVMKYVAQGNFEHQMDGSYKGDFLIMKDSINTTVTNITSYIDEISRVLTNLSQNDLNQSITREYMGSFTIIKDAMNNIINTFNGVISDISSAAEQVAAGAKSISESSMTMAAGATEQASSVEELNATIITINENTARNAENAKSAETLSSGSKHNAAKGDNDMKGMLTAMDGIKDSSGKISRIIKVIEDIAFQTNLLALNAAVEAARAGEHGKGFAVVADEVRTLASRSQTAAKETAELIEESINRVEEGTQIADKTADALRTIMNDVTKVAEIITNIAAASHEQAEAVAQVVLGLNQITSVVQNNSATSEESASASQQLSSQAEVMRNLVSVFKLKRQ